MLTWNYNGPQIQQERPALKLAYGEMQCAITLEILFTILEFAIGFVLNFDNWYSVSLRTILWKNRSLYINKWLSYSQL